MGRWQRLAGGLAPTAHSQWAGELMRDPAALPSRRRFCRSPKP